MSGLKTVEVIERVPTFEAVFYDGANHEEIISWLRDHRLDATWSPSYESPDGRTGYSTHIVTRFPRRRTPGDDSMDRIAVNTWIVRSNPIDFSRQTEFTTYLSEEFEKRFRKKPKNC